MTPRERRTYVSNIPSPAYINDTQIAKFFAYTVKIENDVWLLSSGLVNVKFSLLLGTVVASFCHF